VADVMRERDRLGEVLVERQGPRQRAGDLSHLDRVRQARAKMVAVERYEDLGLVGEAAEGGRMEHAVAVALELTAGSRRRLGIEPSARARRVAGIGRERQPDRQRRDLPSL